MAKKEDFDRLSSEMRTIDAKIEVVAQKIRTIEKNEEVIGRTLLNASARLKKVETGGGALAGGSRDGTSTEDMEKKFASKSDVAELRYVIDAINPLDFATITQVRELLDEKLKEIQAQGGTGIEIQPGKPKREGFNLMEKM